MNRDAPLRRVRRAVLVCALLAAGMHTASWSRVPPPNRPKGPGQDVDVVRVDTTLVTLPVRITDRHGKFVMGLTQKQFHIYEDGIEQEIAYFEPAAETNDARPDSSPKPLTLAFLLDVSDSTQFKLEQIQKAAIAFVDLLRPGDRVMVVAFDKRVQVLAEASPDRSILRAAIHRARVGGGTSLYQALDSIISRLNRIAGRKAIVLLTDGVDTSSKGVSSDDTIRAAEASYVSIYPIQYETYGDFADNSSRETSAVGGFGAIAHKTRNGEPASEAYKHATLYLRLLAEKTSGQFQYADSAKNLARSFERIATQLRQQYTLGYYPKNKTADGAQRLIKVGVGLRKVTVRTRKSYVYKPH
jgi:Ca-activated chloride channel family protein